MSKLIWIEDLLLFKKQKVYITQQLCICALEYKYTLQMQIGDVVFMKDKKRPNSYERLGTIKGFNENKVIVGMMTPYIGIGSKNKMTQLHQQSLVKC